MQSYRLCGSLVNKGVAESSSLIQLCCFIIKVLAE